MKDIGSNKIKNLQYLDKIYATNIRRNYNRAEREIANWGNENFVSILQNNNAVTTSRCIPNVEYIFLALIITDKIKYQTMLTSEV